MHTGRTERSLISGKKDCQPSLLWSDQLTAKALYCAGFKPGTPLSSCGPVLHLHTSVENTTLLQPSRTFSTASTSAPSTTSLVVSMASSTNAANSLGLSVTSVSLAAATTGSAPLVSSGLQY
ncbi:ubiquitin-associated protein 2-like isoform X2 [Harpia harpyja]|uniref:ubiquitin-associated protein 2-like n=1 Tax=Harpia harpyja TaxID=202280 RepID=UPI0022B1CBA1|nr:ubiquitin-associated protein 2-like [Harpia harpyja]XP_052635695.1 ubiquitin-associated protein 2-like isoform X2 [Harpia harpyja]